jgi:hypothetical protein
VKRAATAVLFALTAATLVAMLPRPALAADEAADRVVAMYFHRTQRCPTCLKMGSYSEEAVKSGFADEIKDGKVAFYYIDFQNQANAALTNGYGVSGPTLIVAKIKGNKVEAYKNLTDIWAKVGDKPAFLKYVRENISAYRN